MEYTLTRHTARVLVDCLLNLEFDDPTISKEVEALAVGLDHAQGDADAPGKDSEITLVIKGAALGWRGGLV